VQHGQQPYAPRPYYGAQQHGSPYYGPQQAPGPQASLPPESGPPASGPPQSPRDLARWRKNRMTAWAIVGVGGLAALIAAVGIAQGIGPRNFSATQKQQITDWEYGQRWRDLPAGTIFPASVSYAPPEALDDDATLALAANRVGIGPQATCAANVDAGAAAILDDDGCSAMMRASYVDETSSFVVTVGTAVLPTSAQAAAAAKAVNAASPNPGLGPTVHAMSVAGTPAGQFGDKQRQLSGAVAEGTYVVLYTVGYADGRPKQNVPQDTYTTAEMTSMGTGIANKVLSELAAPVTPAQCPGVPGC
jgi:hypothetical protein